jgi:hypothetical protein
MAYYILGPDGKRVAIGGKTRFGRHREAKAALRRHLDNAFRRITSTYKIQLADRTYPVAGKGKNVG